VGQEGRAILGRIRVESIGGIEVSVLEAAASGSLVAELSGDAPTDYGVGRACEWCAGSVHRFAAPHASGVVLCSRCERLDLLPAEYPPELAGKPSDAVKLERHRSASLARSAAQRALQRLTDGEDAGDALDLAYERLRDSLSLGARPTAGARLYLEALRLLEQLAATPPAALPAIQLDLGIAA
jgi:hypothetical protein